MQRHQDQMGGSAMGQMSEAKQQPYHLRTAPSSNHRSPLTHADQHAYQQHHGGSSKGHHHHAYQSMPVLAGSSAKLLADLGSSNSSSAAGSSLTNGQQHMLADVTFQPLPFYEVIEQLLRPTALLVNNQHSHPSSNRFHETNLNFMLTANQANSISTSRRRLASFSTSSPNSLASNQFSFDYQLQLRFCLLEVTSKFLTNVQIIELNIYSFRCPTRLPAAFALCQDQWETMSTSAIVECCQAEQCSRQGTTCKYGWGRCWRPSG